MPGEQLVASSPATAARASTALNFANNNYQILENIRSIIGELNSTIGNNKANTFIAGYTYQDESRSVAGGPTTQGQLVPDGRHPRTAGSVYTSFGFEMFTPNNELRYKTWQVQDNFTWFRNKHTLTGGVSVEKYHSENVFFPQAQSVYYYNSLEDFYTDANDYLANPNRTTSPVTLRRFQVALVEHPGHGEAAAAARRVDDRAATLQDVWQVGNNLKVTAGLRMDVLQVRRHGVPERRSRRA